ncbi:MAG: glycosyltransferase [Bdellovibrionota bacterium]
MSADHSANPQTPIAVIASYADEPLPGYMLRMISRDASSRLVIFSAHGEKAEGSPVPMISCWHRRNSDSTELRNAIAQHKPALLVIADMNWLEGQGLQPFLKADEHFFGRLFDVPILQVSNDRELAIFTSVERALREAPSAADPRIEANPEEATEVTTSGQSSTNRIATSSQFRILMIHRPNAVTQPGGDTVAMDRLAASLRKLGAHVDIDLEKRLDPTEYDLAHLFNFTDPKLVDLAARRLHRLDVPYVASPMYEDWPRFFSKRAGTYLAFERYVNEGQHREDWPKYEAVIQALKPHPYCDNRWCAEHAELLISSGEEESKSLMRDYPHAKKVASVRWGAQVIQEPVDPEAFVRWSGIRDFVLSVGRIEDRKNQLMLMQALDDEDMPIVFAGSGVSYQPYYENVVRAFRRRKGTVHFLPQIPAELLASAYAACRVHVCPSWYELPGLVSVEAAHYGAKTVVTDYGTIRDYLGDQAWYCDPGSAASIRAAVLEAWDAPKRPELQRRAAECTWERCGEEYLKLYQELLEARSVRRKRSTSRKASLASSIEITSTGGPSNREPQRGLRVLTQMRADAMTMHGGDTIAMTRTAEALQRLGVETVIDLDGSEDPADFDIVHLYNFCNPDEIECFARRAHDVEVPYVVTTLHEPWPEFFVPMNAFASAQASYVKGGRTPELRSQIEPAAQQAISRVLPVPSPNNFWTASHAAALLASGEEERSLLLTAHGGEVPIRITHFGTELPNARESAARFREHTGITEDFVLCVGRVEYRKNQVGLLAALEDSPVTVVIAGGGVTYQPDYLETAANFRRRGKTIILPRVPRDVLLSAYHAARVHALPSWFDLPGLVSLEAAARGCRIVASSRGTLFSYLGNGARYCKPDSSESIRQAVEAAWNDPPSEELKTLAQSFTWARCATEVLGVYKDVLRSRGVSLPRYLESPASSENKLVN